MTTLARSIAIFWCDDRPTTKAVLNAMPLLATASHVYLLTVRHGANGTSPHLARLLASHDVEAEIRVFDRTAYCAGTAILAAAHEVGADLLVMGAYVRHPWAELVTGGVTRYMVTQSDLPLFICH
jgi:nucleotide-binding universal stress UspA family protein